MRMHHFPASFDSPSGTSSAHVPAFAGNDTDSYDVIPDSFDADLTGHGVVTGRGKGRGNVGGEG